MTFKLKGGRPVTHTKWVEDETSTIWTSSASDCNRGTIYKTIKTTTSGGFEAIVVHEGFLKFSDELTGLTSLNKTFNTLAAAKEWCKKTANTIAVKHDALVELTPKDFRKLSAQSAAGSLAEGRLEDFGASQKQTEKFRTKRRRK